MIYDTIRSKEVAEIRARTAVASLNHPFKPTPGPGFVCSPRHFIRRKPSPAKPSQPGQTASLPCYTGILCILHMSGTVQGGILCILYMSGTVQGLLALRDTPHEKASLSRRYKIPQERGKRSPRLLFVPDMYLCIPW